MDTYIYLNSSMCLSIAKRALLQLFNIEIFRGEWTSPCGCCYCTIEFPAILPLLLESYHKTFSGMHRFDFVISKYWDYIFLVQYYFLYIILSFSRFLPTKYSSWCCFSCFNIFWRHLHCYFLLATELTLISQDLAKALLEMFTASKMAKVFFTNSGSEANDTQVYLRCT